MVWYGAVNRCKVKHYSTHKLIRTKSLQTLNKIGQLLQIRQGLSFVLLRSFIEEDSANREVGVGGISRPVGIGLNILANIRSIALSVGGIHIAQHPHIVVRSEFGDLAGVIAIRERVRAGTVSWIDYDGKVDIGVGGYPVAFSGCFSVFFLCFILISRRSIMWLATA